MGYHYSIDLNIKKQDNIKICLNGAWSMIQKSKIK